MDLFSENLLRLRKQRGLSQKDAALSSGIAFRSYRRYEAGEREPTLSTLCIFADYFGVTLDQLAGRTPLPGSEEGESQ